LDVLEFGFAEDDGLLVDGGSFTVWKVGAKTVVMTIFCWGILKKNMETTRQTKVKLVGFHVCMYKQGTWLDGSVKHLSFHLHRFPQSGHLAPHLHRPCCQRCEPFRNPAAAEK
jgi:hypothetical protein